MIYYFIGAVLLIFAAWVAGNLYYNKTITVSQRERIRNLRGEIRHLENAMNSYKESRDYFKEKYYELRREYTFLKDSIKNQTTQP